jgi:hypothetical protein
MTQKNGQVTKSTASKASSSSSKQPKSAVHAKHEGEAEEEKENALRAGTAKGAAKRAGRRDGSVTTTTTAKNNQNNKKKENVGNADDFVGDFDDDDDDENEANDNVVNVDMEQDEPKEQEEEEEEPPTVVDTKVKPPNKPSGRGRPRATKLFHAKQRKNYAALGDDDDDDNEPMVEATKGAMDSFCKPKAPVDPLEEQPALAPHGKRRKRLVEHTTKDARGYIHTETQVVWEDVVDDDENEDDVPDVGNAKTTTGNTTGTTKSSSTTTTTTGATNNNKSKIKPFAKSKAATLGNAKKGLKQGTIMGFFQKK